MKFPGVFEYYDFNQFTEQSDTSTVVMDTYWIRYDDEFMRAKKTGVWQYHTNKEYAQKISAELPGTEVYYMKFCYIPRNPKSS